MNKEMNRQERVQKMLESVKTPVSRADIGLALIGSVDVPYVQSNMVALCECGWKGTMKSAICKDFDDMWRIQGGRRGWHWDCPECGDTIWKYYHTVS